MEYKVFIDSLQDEACHESLDPCLVALWHAAKGNWHRAHEIVQAIDSREAARIHAYLHREEGDDWNSNYWHRRAGSTFPDHLSLEQELDMLIRKHTG